MKRLIKSTPLVAALVLVGCSGDDEPLRGAQVGTTPAAVTVPKATIDAGATSSGLIALAGTALCDVKVTSIQYNTVGGKGEAATASAAVMIPSGTAAGCTGARPVLLYGHGTTIDKGFDMSQVTTNGEAGLVMTMYAAQGFIVVAPNYTGYAGSNLPYHPYLNAEAQSSDMIDALRAARNVFSSLGGIASTKLFISGYSQGGHVAMATHRAMQTSFASEFTVTASGPMSGPYALEKFGQTVYAGTVNGGATVFTPLLIDSYQNSYGNIYSRASEVYQTPYDTIAPGLLPTTDAATIAAFGSNRLPTEMFATANSTTPYLINSTFRQDFNTNANNALRLAGKRNDLLGWKPNSPVALCWGAQDPVVFGFNSTDSAASISALGGTALTFDLEDNSATATVPAALRAGFAGAKTAAGANVLANYHGAIVPAFCHATVRGFFQSIP